MGKCVAEPLIFYQQVKGKKKIVINFDWLKEEKKEVFERLIMLIKKSFRESKNEEYKFFTINDWEKRLNNSKDAIDRKLGKGLRRVIKILEMKELKVPIDPLIRTDTIELLVVVYLDILKTINDELYKSSERIVIIN